MTNKDYILQLEQKLTQQEEIIKNFKKEQSASVQAFKDQAKTIENLQNSNTNLITNQEKLTKTNNQLQEQSKNKDKNLKDFQKENQSLTSQLETATDETELLKERNQDLTIAKQKYQAEQSKNTQLIQKYNQLNSAYEKQAKTLSKIQAELISQQEKNQLLEEKLAELDQEPQPCSNCSEWETEKEELITTFEKTRNEQASEIAELEKENNQLDQDLNKAIDLLESKDQTIANLHSKNQELTKSIQNLQNQAKSTAKNKPQQLFTCSHCNQEWSSEFAKLIDKQNNKTCAECYESMLVQPKEKPEPIKTCQFCQQLKPETSLKPRHILNLPNHDPREAILICSECLYYKAKKADYYCPLTSEGKDTYEGAEFDCYCPINL